MSASTRPRRAIPSDSCTPPRMVSMVAWYNPACSSVSVQNSVESCRGGRSGSTSGSCFRRRSRKGAVMRLSRCSASASERRSIGVASIRRKPGAGAEQAGVEDLHDRPQLVQAVLDRCTGQRHPVAGGDRTGRLRRPCERILDRLGLVQHQRPPGRPGQQLAIARQQRVRGQDHVVPGEILDLGGAVGAVMDVHIEIGSKPVNLAFPVAQH